MLRAALYPRPAMLRPLSVAAALALAVGAAPAPAQVVLAPGLTLVPSGGLQPRASVGVDGARDEARVGFGLRRARIQAQLRYRDRLGVEYDVEAGSGVVQSVDLFAFADLSDRVQVRVGYLPGAQPRSNIPTPYFLIDAVDRAAVAERWAAGTIGGAARDVGLDVRYLGERAQLELFVHNGTGSLARATGNFSESISAPSVLGGPETPGLAVTAAATAFAGSGVEAGAFGGVNGAEGERTARFGEGRSYATGGAHLYWGAVPGSQPVRVKVDALGVFYEEVGGVRQDAVGVSAFGAVRVLGAGEAFARAERFWEDADAGGDDHLTAGLSYSPSAARGLDYHRARVTLAYSYRGGAGADGFGGAGLGDGHLVVLQGQLAF